MDKNDLEKKLEQLDSPKVPALHHRQLKLSILNAKKSARASLWLMSIPVVLLGTAILQTWNILIPPWSWLVKYGPQMPEWLRMFIFISVTMVIPLIALVLNLLSILWLQYDREQHVLHVSIRMRTINVIFIAVTGLIALIFLGHTMADYLSGKD